MSEPNRDDDRYGEDVCVGFAMYCDENGLTLSEGQSLAGQLATELEAAADERARNLALQDDAARWLA